MDGVIKRSVADKGFGFIEGTDGTEYFCHRSETLGRPDHVGRCKRRDKRDGDDHRIELRGDDLRTLPESGDDE